MSDCKDTPACMDRRDFLVKAGFFAGGAVLAISALSTSALAATFDDLTVEKSARTVRSQKREAHNSSIPQPGSSSS